MLRRLKEDVEKNLAPKQETIIEVSLNHVMFFFKLTIKLVSSLLNSVFYILLKFFFNGIWIRKKQKGGMEGILQWDLDIKELKTVLFLAINK